MNSRARLEKLRIKLGLTWESLGEQLDLKRTMLHYVRKGERDLSASALARLREAELAAGLAIETAEALASPRSGEPNVRIEKVAALATQKVPVVSWATAGAGGNFHDCADQIEEHLESDTKDANAYALIIEGDSMMPKFEPGDRVVFEPNREAANGDIVVARVAADGHVYFKLFHLFGARAEMVRLTSFNPAFPPLEFPLKAFRFIHPMHSMVRRYRR